MADTATKAPEADKAAAVEEPKPSKRRPPKLRKQEPPEAKRDEEPERPQDATASPAPDDASISTEDVARDPAGEDEAHDPDPASASESETETASIDEELQPAPAETKRYQPRRTIMLDRDRDAPPEVWRRRNRAPRVAPQNQNRNQQLAPLGGVGDVGNTLDQAGNLVRDVGTKTVGNVGETAGKALGAVVQGSEHGEKEEQLRLRLDLNLDIEVQLKAKIHGDLTLQLLN